MSHRPATDATTEALGGSRFLKVCYGLKQGPVPALDLELEIAVQEAVRELIHCGLVKGAHDCSEGGLAVALTECCFNPEGLLGAKVNVGQVSNVRDSGSVAAATATLFNEAQSRIVISVAPEKVEPAIRIIKDRNVPYQQLGEVEDKELSIRIADEEFRWPIADLHDDWWNAIRRAVEQDESIPSL
jgi:phosphoribosylformylglycinamidine synthase